MALAPANRKALILIAYYTPSQRADSYFSIQLIVQQTNSGNALHPVKYLLVAVPTGLGYLPFIPLQDLRGNLGIFKKIELFSGSAYLRLHKGQPILGL